jgi:hypothetical protein
MNGLSADNIHDSQLSRLWAVLALSSLVPLSIAILWGDIYTDAAYDQFLQAQEIAAGAAWNIGIKAPLYTLLLALASHLHLQLPFIAAVLSVIGWMSAIAVWFLIGLSLGQPTFAAVVAILLAFHPTQGRVLGTESGLALGLTGLAAWWTIRRQPAAALITMLVLIAIQPSTLFFVLPLFICCRIRKPATSPKLATVAASVALGATCVLLICALSDSWNDLRQTALLFMALDILVAAGFAFLAPDLNWLAPPVADRRTVKKFIVLLGLVTLLLWQGRTLVRDWQFRPTARWLLYGTLAQWVRDHTLPTETIAARQASLLGYLSRRTTIPIPDTTNPSTLIEMIDSTRPDYCIALNSLVWHGVQSQPWFQERYAETHQVYDPHDTGTPLTVFRYVPTPFDAGQTISITAAFTFDTGEYVELVGYRLDQQRITPGEPLHLTLYWRAASPIHQPLLSTVRLIDPTTGQVWTQLENPAPGGLATDLWNSKTNLYDRYILIPPADIPDGDYALDVALSLPNGQPLSLRTGDEVRATRLLLNRIPRLPSVSTVPLVPDHTFSATFGSEIELLGYDMTDRIAPGGRFRVALYWHVLQPVSLNYKVFVHVLSLEDQPALLAQDDSIPVGWTYPTTEWQAGETVRDEHILTIPHSGPRGDYRVVVGLYDPDTNASPVVYDAAGSEITDRRVILQQVQVR